MNLSNRSGAEDKKTLREKTKNHSKIGIVNRLRDGVSFVRGRLLRIRRKSGLAYARTAAAAERFGRRLADAAEPTLARAKASLTPRLSRAASAVRLTGIALAVIVGSPVARLVSLAAAKMEKRFGIHARKVYIGVGGTAFAALAVVCLLLTPALLPDRDTVTDTTGGELTADAGDTNPSSESETALTAPVEIEEEKPAAWELLIDGKPVVALATQADAESVVEKVKASYLNGGSELLQAEIKEDLQVALSREDSGAAGEITDVDAAVSYILTGTKEPKIYTVQNGDTVWAIARANHISQDELVKSNPGLIPNKLKIGQLLNLYETKPYLTIRTVEIASAVESIAFQTNYENSEELYKGQTQVLVAGVPGAKAIQTQITKENGIVVESVEIGSVITAEPQAQTALVGTKPLETFTGSGRLISPLTHIEISSAFGSRGNRRHQGVDMRSPKGSPIYASDAGVVTTSTYKGSYGNLIILNHGNGLETYYAHCDTRLVSVGDVVSQGQQIGTVGITGNATGYHLHFEVRVNGVYQNPLNYF
jgi:murein DD-endopeptidase MepM/ murein hydrolase activator NlpD